VASSLRDLPLKTHVRAVGDLNELPVSPPRPRDELHGSCTPRRALPTMSSTVHCVSHSATACRALEHRIGAIYEQVRIEETPSERVDTVNDGGRMVVHYCAVM
jgi:hypothetical protein